MRVNNMRQLVILSIWLAGVNCVTLDGLSAPSYHRAGEPLSLSCDYSYEESESSQLVVTWYFNGSPVPIYQWVPSLDKGPQIIHEMFKDNLDLTHQADEDKFKKHSALRIINPDQKFAGNYRCRVSTFTKEVTHSKDVSIYVVPPSISLTYSQGVIKCGVEGVYPPPAIVLSWTYNLTVHSDDAIEIAPNSLDDDLYDAWINTTIDEEYINPHDMMTCDMLIAEAGFEERVEKIILEKGDSVEGHKVQLVEDLCNSADCATENEDAADDSNPVDNEVVDKTIDVGAGFQTFSEEAAGFIENGCSSPRMMAVFLVLLSLCYIF